MSYLSYQGLKRAIEDPAVPPERRLQVQPYDPSRLRSASLELHLGSTIARWRHRGQISIQLSPKRLSEISDRDFEITRNLAYGDVVVVEPGEALLMAVDCWIGVGHGLIGRVEGKSSIGRAGQIIHTAGFVDPGFVGVLVVEPINFAPFAVAYEVGTAIAQLTVATTDEATIRPYGHPSMGSRYQGQHEVTPPRMSPTMSPWDGPATIPAGD